MALATRGGYGCTRLLDQLNWKAIAHSIEHGTRWVGYSDFTGFQNALIAHARGLATWSARWRAATSGRSEAEGGVDDITQDCFLEAMSGALRPWASASQGAARGIQPFDGLEARGLLWAAISRCCAHCWARRISPGSRGGVLFLEDVGEHPYRIERMLLQLQQAGVIDAQAAVLLGDFSGWTRQSTDRVTASKDAVAALRARTRTPVLTGLPIGHCATKVCLPVGAKVDLFVQGREVILGWQSDHRLAHRHAHPDTAHAH